MADDIKKEEIKEETKKETKSKSKKTSAKVSKIVDDVSTLTVLELSDLVSTLQEKLGVSAMAVATPQTTSGQVAATEAAPAADAVSGGNQTVVLTNTGSNKIAVIKALREINQNLTLMEAKGMTEQVPVEVLKDAKAEDVKVASDKLKAAGASIELK